MDEIKASQEMDEVKSVMTDQGWVSHYGSTSSSTAHPTVPTPLTEIFEAGRRKAKKLSSQALQNSTVFSEEQLQATLEAANSQNPQFDSGVYSTGTDFYEDLVRNNTYPITDSTEINTSNMVTARQLRLAQHHLMKLSNDTARLSAQLNQSAAYSQATRRATKLEAENLAALHRKFEAKVAQMQRHAGLTGPRQRACPQTLDSKQRYIEQCAADNIELLDTPRLVVWLNDRSSLRNPNVYPHPDTYFVLKALGAHGMITLVPDCRRKPFDYNSTVKLSITKRASVDRIQFAMPGVPWLPGELRIAGVRKFLLYVKRTAGYKAVSDAYGGYQLVDDGNLPIMRKFMSDHGIDSDLICTYLLMMNVPVSVDSYTEW